MVQLMMVTLEPWFSRIPVANLDGLESLQDDAVGIGSSDRRADVHDVIVAQSPCQDGWTKRPRVRQR